jgi:hypothetical protein
MSAADESALSGHLATCSLATGRTVLCWRPLGRRQHSTDRPTEQQVFRCDRVVTSLCSAHTYATGRPSALRTHTQQAGPLLCVGIRNSSGCCVSLRRAKARRPTHSAPGARLSVDRPAPRRAPTSPLRTGRRPGRSAPTGPVRADKARSPRALDLSAVPAPAGPGGRPAPPGGHRPRGWRSRSRRADRRSGRTGQPGEGRTAVPRPGPGRPPTVMSSAKPAHVSPPDRGAATDTDGQPCRSPGLNRSAPARSESEGTTATGAMHPVEHQTVDRPQTGPRSRTTPTSTPPRRIASYCPGMSRSRWPVTSSGCWSDTSRRSGRQCSAARTQHADRPKCSSSADVTT